MKKVLVTGSSVAQVHLDRLRSNGFDVENPQGHLNEDQVISALKGSQVYLLGGLEIATDKILENVPDIQLIAFLGVGYQSFIADETATQLGIAITNTPGVLVDSVAELTVGHLIGLRRQISNLNSQAKKGFTIEDKSHELRGRIAGIVGMGAIGSRVAQILSRGLGMKIIYHNRSSRSEVERELGAQKVSLEKLLSDSDVVLFHVPLTTETRSMIGAKQLALMKPGALIINTANPKIIDGHALYTAITSKKLAGAAFDGYYIEPLPTIPQDEWKLLSLSDSVFVVTPHVGSLTEEARDRMATTCVDSIISFYKNGNDAHIVNPQYRKSQKKRS